jgi:hypothetical protein
MSIGGGAIAAQGQTIQSKKRRATLRSIAEAKAVSGAVGILKSIGPPALPLWGAPPVGKRGSIPTFAVPKLYPHEAELWDSLGAAAMWGQ